LRKVAFIKEGMINSKVSF